MDNQRLIYRLLNVMNRLWRILAASFGFALFGFGGLVVLSTLWFNVLRLFVWQRKTRNIIAQYSISCSFKFFLWVVKKLGVLDYQFEGLELLEQDQGCLIVANHPSLLDVVFLASVMPRCNCMVKESLLKNIFVSGVIKAAGYIPNTEANKMRSYCQQTLAEQGRILIFPEGTRSIPNQPLKLHRGAANIALRCHADIRIIHIECHPAFLIKNQKWYQAPLSKPVFNISVGEKIEIARFMNENMTISARRLTQYMAQKLYNTKTV